MTCVVMSWWQPAPPPQLLFTWRVAREEDTRTYLGRGRIPVASPWDAASGTVVNLHAPPPLPPATGIEDPR